MDSAKVYHGGGTAKPSFSSGGGLSQDKKVAITENDTTPDYLKFKLSEGNEIGFNFINPGGDEEIRINSNDQKIRISDVDTTSGFWDDKIKSGAGIVFTKLNPAFNEEIVISTNIPGGNPEITLEFTETGQLLEASALLNAPTDSGVWSNPGMGYYLDEFWRIKHISAVVNRFSTFFNGSVCFGLREIIANGSKTGSVANGGGNLLQCLTVSLPNTAGVDQYYAGGSIDVDIGVTGNMMLFCDIEAQDFTTAFGASLFVRLEKEPE